MSLNVDGDTLAMKHYIQEKKQAHLCLPPPMRSRTGLHLPDQTPHPIPPGQTER